MVLFDVLTFKFRSVSHLYKFDKSWAKNWRQSFSQDSGFQYILIILRRQY